MIILLVHLWDPIRRGMLLNVAMWASWTLLSALALLIGAAPFLRRPQPLS